MQRNLAQRGPRLLAATAALACLHACASHVPLRASELEPARESVASSFATRSDTPPAQEPEAGAGDEQALKQANNPLANMRALNFHDYHIGEVSGTEDTANTFWVRYAQPVSTGFGDWLVRASLPLQTVPTAPLDSDSGVGDANVFATYLFDSADPSLSYGLGPMLGIPTAAQDTLGTDQWSGGLAAVFFDARSSQMQWGSLVTWQGKFAGSDRAPDVNLLAVQPFGFLQLGNGLCARSTGIWAFDLERGDYSVPIGLGLGKVVKAGNTVFNVFLEPQFTVLHEGSGQPEFQLFFGFNTQFLGG